MKRTMTLLLSLVLAAAGCDDGDDKPTVTTDAGTPAADGGGGGSDTGNAGDGGTTPELPFVLTDWVHDLVTKHTNQISDPDTVDDKEGRLQITEDQAAFEPILMQQ
jgi:hypothetical protein